MLAVLADLGLMKMNPHKGFPFRIKIELTGRKVAKYLALIDS